MLPIVDTNWSPTSQDTATGCHILRAVAVQAVMSNAEVDINLASLNQHAKIPGLGGLPHGIAAYLDVYAADAFSRVDELISNARVLGVNVVLASTSEMDTSLIKSCIHLLASNHASIDISGDIDSVDAFIKMAAQHPQLQFVLNISQCSHANKLLTKDKWGNLASMLKAHGNVAVKLTEVPEASGAEFDKAVDQLAQAIAQLADSIGIKRIVFGSSSTETTLPDSRPVWQVLDAATRRASALERDQLFRENAVSLYRL